MARIAAMAQPGFSPRAAQPRFGGVVKGKAAEALFQKANDLFGPLSKDEQPSVAMRVTYSRFVPQRITQMLDSMKATRDKAFALTPGNPTVVAVSEEVFASRRQADRCIKKRLKQADSHTTQTNATGQAVHKTQWQKLAVTANSQIIRQSDKSIVTLSQIDCAALIEKVDNAAQRLIK